MPFYRVERTFDVRAKSISEVMKLDSKLEMYLKRRLRHPIRTSWVLGGTSGFLYSDRKLSQDLVRNGHASYTFHLLTGEESKHATEILGVYSDD